MQVLLNTDNHVERRQGLAEHLETVVKEALHRFGDHVTLVALNAEVTYATPGANWSGWRPYVGGGPGFNIWEFHEGWPHFSDFGFDTSTTDVGLNLMFGVSKVLNIGHEFMFELKLGHDDSPDAKFTFGLTFF